MKKLLKLVKSPNGCVQKQIRNLTSLKLKKIGDASIVEYNESTIGRIKKVQHLIVMEDIKK
ncbi:uL30 family ribosomal protein [Alphaproteobacteria bacterium endosymbiont of Tiliacea citrago]|uniref:uL30 family ribosomal protein n=1 Tax=Alphaproteobacteria bacterium endosymbiont of Tiliacea citrago TaxID=3077944 RepID=UPI00313E70E2